AALAWLRLAGRPGQLAKADVEEAARRPSAGRSRTLIGWMGEQSSVPALRALAGRLKAERDQTKVTAFADLVERLAARLDGTSAGLGGTVTALRQSVPAEQH